MKKLLTLGLVLSLILSFSSNTVLAKDTLKLTANQQSILHEYGLTEQQIDKLDLSTLRSALRGEFIKNRPSAKVPDLSESNVPESTKAKLAEKGITPGQAKSLDNMGFSVDQMLAMDAATVKELAPLSTLAAPSGYIYASIPEGGGYEWLNPNVDINNLALFVSSYRRGGAYIFNEASTSNFRYNYYIYGEWDANIGTHEGVDLQDVATYNRPVRSVTPGVVIGRNDSLGTVQIYDSYLDETITYMHMTNISVSVGSNVAVGNTIGKQGAQQATGYHLHFQAVDGRTTYISTGKDNILESRQPSGFLVWYI